MAYTPTNWSTGDTVTATKLNKMEAGIASGGNSLVLTIGSNSALSATAAEIIDAINEGTLVYLHCAYGSGESMVQWCKHIRIVGWYRYQNSQYRFYAPNPLDIGAVSGVDGDSFEPAVALFTANSLNGYPTFTGSIAYNANKMKVSALF